MALVLAGITLHENQAAQTIAPLNSLPASSVITLTRATFIISSQHSALSTLQILVKANITQEQSIVLCSLSLLQPTCSLQLTFHADSEPSFWISSHNYAGNDTQNKLDVSVHLSGYVEVEEGEEELQNDNEEKPMNEFVNADHKLRMEDEQGEQDDDDEDEQAEEEEFEQSHLHSKKRLHSATSTLQPQEQTVAHDNKSNKSSSSKSSADVKRLKGSNSSSSHSNSNGNDNDDKVASKREKSSNSIRHANGLVLQDEVVGVGAVAKTGKLVSIRYRGELSNGKVFDSNLPKGRPFEFRLGNGDCIRGFDIGVNGMRVGGRRVIKVPSALGYGKEGAGPSIPPNADLQFTVELIKVK